MSKDDIKAKLEAKTRDELIDIIYHMYTQERQEMYNFENIINSGIYVAEIIDEDE